MITETEKIQHLFDFFKEYTSAISCISPGYINIKVFGMNGTILRERVYCYELYYQLKSRMKKRIFPYIIHGEMDKAGRSDMTGIPDFIIHQAGIMENLLVIEVKHSNSTLRDISDDIEKLTKYVSDNSGNYFRGLSHLYGDFSCDKIKHFQTLLGEKTLLLIHYTKKNDIEIYDKEQLIFKMKTE